MTSRGASESFLTGYMSSDRGLMTRTKFPQNLSAVQEAISQYLCRRMPQRTHAFLQTGTHFFHAPAPDSGDANLLSHMSLLPFPLNIYRCRPAMQHLRCLLGNGIYPCLFCPSCGPKTGLSLLSFLGCSKQPRRLKQKPI